jgi:hypothetical protein
VGWVADCGRDSAIDRVRTPATSNTVATDTNRKTLFDITHPRLIAFKWVEYVSAGGGGQIPKNVRDCRNNALVLLIDFEHLEGRI